jgi:hypothetical protein
MAVLIDGYNLLHVTAIVGRGVGPGGLHRSRQALLNFLVASLHEKELTHAEIVFDASGAPPGLPATVDHQGLTVHYARDYPDADTMLEFLIAKHPTPRKLTVVSSDHRIQRAAKRRRAIATDSDLWYAELVQRRRETPHSDVSLAKPEGELDPSEVKYWTDQFAELPADVKPANEGKPPAKPPPQPDTKADDLANPFPPGYAEELLDENDL